MKLSVSLPAEDVEFLDQLARSQSRGTRSSILHLAVTALREQELAKEYEQAAAEWAAGDGDAWEAAAGDGLA
jgi:Arc/MetJ-type ribon-helix-helix transcriptional regulator